MLKHNIRPGMVSVIRLLYDHAKSTVLIGGKYSSWFQANAGVRQECVLSPTLFNIFLELIMIDTLGSISSGVKIGDKQLQICVLRMTLT